MRDFNPRPPRGERRLARISTNWSWIFQSTPSARRATPPPHDLMGWHPISIHALREESDVLNTIYSTRANDFNPRPPRGERRCVTPFNYRGTLFQSTPSARRATSLRCKISGRRPDFNPRPPRGGRQTISWADQPKVRFQSTPSARRATAGSVGGASVGLDFNPRPPRGGRPVLTGAMEQATAFQSTPSARRATTERAIKATDKTDFNPRPPRGGRPQIWESKQF